MTTRRTHRKGGLPQSSRSWTVGLAGLAMAIVVVAAVVHRGSAPTVLLGDILLVACGGVVVIHVARGRLHRWTPWLAAGALSGAALIAVVQVAPWPLTAAVSFALAGVVGARGTQSRLTARLGIVLLSAAGNTTLLWILVFSEHRPVSADEFYARELRLHGLLADVPLHDTWVAHLRGGPQGVTMQDLRWLLVDGFRHNLNTALVAAAGMREVLGSLFQWDDERCEDDNASFVHRLTESDRRRSLTEPGDSLFVYTFEREALIEIMNCTVHAFIGMSLEPVEDGYDMYWAFYVKRVGWITPFYMALIEPFRHTVVYPPIIEGIEKEWARRWSASDPELQATLGSPHR